MAAEHAGRTTPRTGLCAAARSRGTGPILSRFCRDPGLSRDNSPNSGSYGPLRGHAYHITNIGLVGEVPETEQNSWTTPIDEPYNSYRNNIQGASDFCAPDLLPQDLNFDAGACAAQLDLSVHVANHGCLGVGPGINVSFYEQQLGLLGTVKTKGPLVAGGSEIVKLSVPGQFVSVTVWAVVDDNGKGAGLVNECIEDNNTGPMSMVCVPRG